MSLVQLNPQPEYVYMTIPREYVCVYHKLLALLADYGEDMLKDCKASCNDRNSTVIECFNMFNAAIAARKLGDNNPQSKYTKLASTLIVYIKAKINSIYKGPGPNPSFIFPVDENGQLKAFVSCNDAVKLYINSDDMELYEHKITNEAGEHFHLGHIDFSKPAPPPEGTTENVEINFTPLYELIDGHYHAGCEFTFLVNSVEISNKYYSVHYYFDNKEVLSFNNIIVRRHATYNNIHEFKVVVVYKGKSYVDSKSLEFPFNPTTNIIQ